MYNKSHPTIPCVYCCNNLYAPYATTSIASLCYTTNQNIHIYILDDNLSVLNKKNILDLETRFKNLKIDFISINCEKIFSKIKKSNIFPYITYGTILIPDLCNDNKVIYCDSDVIFLDDIEILYNQSLYGCGLGAVQEANIASSCNLTKIVHDRLKLDKNHIYFNAGVLLIDNNYWRQHAIGKYLMEIGIQNSNKLKWADQDILNIGFSCAYTQLSDRFNFTTKVAINALYNSNHISNNDSIVIRHFESERKPWLTAMYTKDQPLPNFEDFWKFASMTTFYRDLEQAFEHHSRQDSPPEYLGNIIKPDKSMLTSLRMKCNKNLSHDHKNF